jgi:hypothetical protein
MVIIQFPKMFSFLNAHKYLSLPIMDLGALAKRLGNVKDSLKDTEETMKRVSETLKDSDLPENERIVARDEYFSHLKDYEQAYERANEDYQKEISGLSEAYLSLCPLYQGPNLPKTTFLDSSQDIKELYGLFMMAGLFSLFGSQSPENKSKTSYTDGKDTTTSNQVTADAKDQADQ